MKRISVIILMVAFFSEVHAQDVSKGMTITIINPSDSAQVAHRERITGNVSDPSAEVYVVIMAELVNQYYVQPDVTMDDDGNWSVLAFFGEKSTAPGTPFLIRAFSNPKSKLKIGRIDKWPKAEATSEVIYVTRR